MQQKNSLALDPKKYTENKELDRLRAVFYNGLDPSRTKSLNPTRILILYKVRCI